MNVAGRTILLTGATGGIGAAIARAAVARGAALVLTGRQADVLDALAAEVRGRAIVADLAEPGAAAALAEQAGPVDVLIANAALPASGPVLEYTPEQIDRSVGVNLTVPIQLARALAPGMVERGAGHVVFMSSLSGKAATPGTSLYSATKFGLRGFASGLRQDLHGTGVGVSTVFPGFVRDAGMFHDTGTRLPKWVGTVSPGDVAESTLRAIEHDRAETDVAPFGLRAGSAFASLFPEAAARLARRLGSDVVSRRMGSSEAHRSRR
ncbi:MAG: SDR family NAD(P)-dependent oxidoreductase [Solirubrobacteraceae bacterium]